MKKMLLILSSIAMFGSSLFAGWTAEGKIGTVVVDSSGIMIQLVNSSGIEMSNCYVASSLDSSAKKQILATALTAKVNNSNVRLFWDGDWTAILVK